MYNYKTVYLALYVVNTLANYLTVVAKIVLSLNSFGEGAWNMVFFKSFTTCMPVCARVDMPPLNEQLIQYLLQ